MTQTWDGTTADVCPLTGDEPITRPVGGRCDCCGGDGYTPGAWKGPATGGYWHWLCLYCDGTGRQRRHTPHGEPVRYDSAIAAWKAVKAARGPQ